MKRFLLFISFFVFFCLPIESFAISLDEIKDNKNQYITITTQNAVTYIVDKQSIHQISELDNTVKINAIVYEVEIRGFSKPNPMIHKVHITYKYDMKKTMANMLSNPYLSQNYAQLLSFKLASSGMKITMNSIEDYTFEGIEGAASNNLREQYYDIAIYDPKYVVGDYIFSQARGEQFDNSVK